MLSSQISWNPGFSIDPFCGTRMALINGLADLGKHPETKLTQTFRLTSTNVFASLNLEWGAFLVDGGHGSDEQAAFRITVRKGMFGVIAEYEATASDVQADGWTEVGSLDGDPVWFKRGSFELPLAYYSAGDRIQIEMVASCCDGVDGGHGACAFLDCVSIQPCSNVVGDMDATPANFFSPNGDGVNDDWGVLDITNATFVRMEVFNEWGIRVFQNTQLQPNGFYNQTLLPWDGTYLGWTVSEGWYFYVVTLRNCNTSEELPGFLYVGL